MKTSKIKNKILEIFDNSKLSELLTSAIKSSFNSILKLIKNEELYSFGIYTSGEYNYIEITGNTHEGLHDKSLEYAKIDSYKNRTIKELEMELKWSPCDWKYHCKVEIPDSDTIQSFLDEIFELSDLLYDSLSDKDEALEMIDKLIISRFNNLFVSILKNMTTISGGYEELIFGVWKGDQSEEEREWFISKINSEDKTSKFKKESEIGYQVYFSKLKNYEA
ncbi:DUF4303 domain-containing protein [uncultured Aquimarina sp.]|uniref:DUF4303 domain-containing protein n=1 Tax=uncultured Aquimarina sp. TaxID=575652 RepID=UPI002638C475|nr:DUF4303 domain-containing protein [uncultured Aquimarina sp.]